MSPCELLRVGLLSDHHFTLRTLLDLKATKGHWLLTSGAIHSGSLHQRDCTFLSVQQQLPWPSEQVIDVDHQLYVPRFLVFSLEHHQTRRSTMRQRFSLVDLRTNVPPLLVQDQINHHLETLPSLAATVGHKEPSVGGRLQAPATTRC